MSTPKERLDPPDFGNEDLWKMNADGSSQTRIADTPSVDEVERDWQPI